MPFDKNGRWVPEGGWGASKNTWKEDEDKRKQSDMMSQALDHAAKNPIRPVYANKPGGPSQPVTGPVGWGSRRPSTPEPVKQQPTKQRSTTRVGSGKFGYEVGLLDDIPEKDRPSLDSLKGLFDPKIAGKILDPRPGIEAIKHDVMKPKTWIGMEEGEVSKGVKPVGDALEKVFDPAMTAVDHLRFGPEKAKEFKDARYADDGLAAQALTPMVEDLRDAGAAYAGGGLLKLGKLLPGVSKWLNSMKTTKGALRATPQVTQSLTEQAAKQAVKTGIVAGGANVLQGGTTPNIEDRNLAQKLGASLQYGSGETQHLAGAAAKYFGFNRLGDELVAAGDRRKEGFEVEEPDGPLWQKLLDPNYYATTVAKTLPTSIALLPLGMGGMAGGMAAAGRLGYGTFGRTVMGSLGASALTAPVEAAMEAGAVYEETGDREAADKTFWRNMAILGVTNSAEFASMFASKGVTAALDSVTGRVVTGAAAGAAEETAQDWASTTAKGQPYKFDPEQAVIGGLISGGLSFATGMAHMEEADNHVYSIKNRVLNKLDDETKAELNEALADARAQGISEEAATAQILDTIAEQHPNGQRIIQEAVQEEVESAQEKETAQGQAPAQSAEQPTNIGGQQQDQPAEGLTATQREQQRRPETGDYVTLQGRGNVQFNVIEERGETLVVLGNKGGKFKVNRSEVTSATPGLLSNTPLYPPQQQQGDPLVVTQGGEQQGQPAEQPKAPEVKRQPLSDPQTGMVVGMAGKGEQRFTITGVDPKGMVTVVSDKGGHTTVHKGNLFTMPEQAAEQASSTAPAEPQQKFKVGDTIYRGFSGQEGQVTAVNDKNYTVKFGKDHISVPLENAHAVEAPSFYANRDEAMAETKFLADNSGTGENLGFNTRVQWTNYKGEQKTGTTKGGDSSKARIEVDGGGIANIAWNRTSKLEEQQPESTTTNANDSVYGKYSVDQTGEEWERIRDGIKDGDIVTVRIPAAWGPGKNSEVTEWQEITGTAKWGKDRNLGGIQAEITTDQPFHSSFPGIGMLNHHTLTEHGYHSNKIMEVRPNREIHKATTIPDVLKKLAEQAQQAGSFYEFKDALMKAESADGQSVWRALEYKVHKKNITVKLNGTIYHFRYTPGGQGGGGVGTPKGPSVSDWQQMTGNMPIAQEMSYDDFTNMADGNPSENLRVKKHGFRDLEDFYKKAAIWTQIEPGARVSWNDGKARGKVLQVLDPNQNGIPQVAIEQDGFGNTIQLMDKLSLDQGVKPRYREDWQRGTRVEWTGKDGVKRTGTTASMALVEETDIRVQPDDPSYLGSDRTTEFIKLADLKVISDEKPLQTWLKEQLDQYNELADKWGISDTVEEHAGNRMTARQSAIEILKQFPNIQVERREMENYVRAVRAKRNIPSQDQKTEFDAWLNGRNPTEEPPAAEQPAASATQNNQAEPKTVEEETVAGETSMSEDVGPGFRFEGPFVATHTFHRKLVQVYATANSKRFVWRYDPDTITGPGTLGGNMPKDHPEADQFKPLKTKQEKPANSRSQQIADQLKELIRQGKEIKSGDLYRIADQVYRGTQGEGKYTPKDAYDALELAVNQYLLEPDNGMDFTTKELQSVKVNLNVLGQLTNRLPTQTKRTEEQERFQQFSTPPPIAYIAAWIANIGSNDVVLEPSAGIGGMALFGKANGAEVIVNELDPRRLEVLRQLPFDQYFSEDAEQINNILPKTIKPTVVIMNPPFSTSATRGVTNTKNSFNHVDQALKRLADGGRLVAILGYGREGNSKAFTEWLNNLNERYNVRAAVAIDGQNYAKYGTTYDVQFVVIDKIGPRPTQYGLIQEKAKTLYDVIDLMGGIAGDRQEAAPRNRVGEQNADQSAGIANSSQDSEGRPNASGGGRSGSSGSASSVGNTGRRGTDPVDEPGADVQPVDEADTTPVTAQDDGRIDDAGRRNDDGNEGIVTGEPEGSRDESTGSVDQQEDSTGDNSDAGRPGPVKELTDAVFEDYEPRNLNVKNAKKHPGQLAESAAMSAISPPVLHYTMKLPREIIENGILSNVQLEVVAYAGQAHSQMLPDDTTRKGIFVGDGTGVGKGREMSGIILDNFMQGRTKAVWVSENDGLLKSAKRDWSAMGRPEAEVFKKPKLGEKIKQATGILFTTYNTLASGQSDDAGAAAMRRPSRLDQLVEWLGPNFDGVVVFDEAHNMANALDSRGARGIKKASKRALAGVELQRRIPNARIVYASATGATEVSNLAYTDRLGLWGTGTAFASQVDFINKINAGGIAAMELVARDMKSLGLYIARSLSYNGVEYQKLTHNLTPAQTEIYDLLAHSWQIVLQNIHSALEAIGATKDGKTLSANAKKNAIGQFWGAQQRFFNQVLTAMQMPRVIEEAKKDLAEGKAIVMQLVNTNEASQDRQIAKVEEEEGDLEDLDLTPRDILLQFIEKSFPVQQYEDYMDDKGNIRSQPVTDSQGNPVINAEAQAMKDELMSRLSAVRVPEGPLELVLNTFGAENVAEITGRGQRLVDRMNENTGRVERVLEKRSFHSREADADAFMDGKKNILVFSNAGGTGRSYHADRTAKNQKQRMHYLIQAGWEATKAVQGFGRTHRTNQASMPVYKLFTTNLKGQMRFVSSIARRLDQLGALTKGQRQTGSQGLFSAADNLESNTAKRALVQFYHTLANDYFPHLDKREVLGKMGLADKIMDKDGKFINDADELTEITKFLNRILTLESGLQNKVFEAFATIVERMTQIALQDGTLDTGLENVKADTTNIVDEKEIRRDEISNSVTTYYQLELGHKTNKVRLSNQTKRDDFQGVYRNERSKAVTALHEAGNKTLENGDVVIRYFMQGAASHDIKYIDEIELNRSTWKKLPMKSEVQAEIDDVILALQAAGMSEAEATEQMKRTILNAEDAWDAALKEVPKYRTETVHMISGTLLPVWDRLPTDRVRVVRVLTDEGKVLLGRIIADNAIDNTLYRLGAEARSAAIDLDTVADKILDEGYTVVLSNGWKLSKRRISGEWRIEISGDELYKYAGELRNAGVFTERIAYETRYFVPTGDTATDTIKEIVKHRPIAEMTSPTGATLRGSAQDQMASNVNAEAQGGIGIVAPGFGSRTRSRNRNRLVPEAPDHIEQQIRDSRRTTNPGLLHKIGARFQQFKNQLTREFEHLPKTPAFEPLRQKLLQLLGQKDVAKFKTYRIMLQGITQFLDKAEFELFERKVLIDDQYEEMKRGGALNFDFTPQEVQDYKDILDQSAADNRHVTEALQKRQKLWDEVKEDYFQVMESIGFHVRDKLTREHYFRRLVIQHAEEFERKAQAGGRVRKLQTPSSSGFAKSRSGEFTGNHITDYLVAEGEVLTQMIYDTAKADVIRFVDQKHNQIGRLKEEARDANRDAMKALFQKEKEDEEDPDAVSPTEQKYKVFDQRIAMGFQGFTKRNPQDMWMGDNEEFAEVVADLTAGIERDPRHPDTFRYLSALAQRDEVGSSLAGMILKNVTERRLFVEETLGAAYATPERLAKQQRLRLWQPRPGTVFFRKSAQEDVGKIADDMFTLLVKSFGVPQEAFDEMIGHLNKAVGKDVLAVGARRQEFALLPEIADTLDNITDDPDYKGVMLATRWITRKFKQAVLISPNSVVKYNFRNTTSDLEKTLAGNPNALKMVYHALYELSQVYYRGAAGSLELRQYIDRGGLANVQQVNEMGDVAYIKHFERFYEDKPKSPLLLRPFMAWYRTARTATDFREAVLRYANYLEYLEQMKRNPTSRPDNFGSSKREFVMALEDQRDRAYKLSNELLVDYQATSVVGKSLSDTGIYPFFRWVEGNIKSTTGLMLNALKDDRFASVVGRKVLGKLAFRSPYIAYRVTVNVGKLTLGLSVVAILAQLWNNLMYPDQEDKLPDDVKNSLHIIFGYGNGKTRYIDRLGFFEDYLGWLGMDNIVSDIRRVLDKERSLPDTINANWHRWVNKALGGVAPLVKMIGEVPSGLSFYPDVFNPTANHKWYEPVLAMFSLRNEGKMIRDVLNGTPTPPKRIADYLLGFVSLGSDPGEAAYYDVRDWVGAFKRKNNIPIGSSKTNDRRNALYNYKLALRYGDEEAMDKYYDDYVAAGGNYNGLKTSLSSLDPLFGLSRTMRYSFEDGLSKRQLEVYERAKTFVDEVLLGQGKKE